MFLLNRASSFLLCLQDCAQAAPVLVWLPLTQTELCPFLNLGELMLGPSASGECFLLPFSHGANITVLLCVKEQQYLHETLLWLQKGKAHIIFLWETGCFSCREYFLPLVTKDQVLSVEVAATGQAPTICCRNKGHILIL